VNVSVAGGIATVTISSAGLSVSQVQTLVDGLTYTNNLISPGEVARDVTLTSIHDTGRTAPPDSSDLPLAVCPKGTILKNRSEAELARAL
jgi:hypothetical protein